MIKETIQFHCLPFLSCLIIIYDDSRGLEAGSVDYLHVMRLAYDEKQ